MEWLRLLSGALVHIVEAACIHSQLDGLACMLKRGLSVQLLLVAGVVLSMALPWKVCILAGPRMA